MKKSTVVASFTSPIETVWSIVTDNTSYAWRSDLEKIKVSDDGKNFIEVTKDRFETEFSITIKKPYDLYEFDIKIRVCEDIGEDFFQKMLLVQKLNLQRK